MDSKIGLIIQLSGIIFITTLMFLLTQSLKSNTLKNWKNAWLSLAFALLSLQMAFSLNDYPQPFYILYYFGEYLFGYYLISGCYNFSTDKTLPFKQLFFLIPAGFLACLLAFSTNDFNNVFNLHTFVIGTLFAVSFFAIKPKGSKPTNLGWGIMRVSLAFLALDFYHHSFLFSLRLEFLAPYLSFNPIVDLMFETFLGFGMVIVLLEKVLLKVEEANCKLQIAHEKLEQWAQTDPLTTAFNRHAFYGFLKKRGDSEAKVSGCVGFFDIDDLKPINDQFGHSAGDSAIREVSNAIRSLLRVEDLIFRWGGDEFFVIMIGMDAQMARQRMSRLTDSLRDIQIFGMEERVTINVSSGFNNFEDSSELELAIQEADEEMYRVKQDRKRAKPTAASLPEIYEQPLMPAFIKQITQIS